jgi:hypothetical protein
MPDAEDVDTPEEIDFQDVRGEAVREAIGSYVKEQISGNLVEDLVEACGEKADLPELAGESEDAAEVHEELQSRLENRPPQPWTDVNKEIVDEWVEEARKAKADLKKTVEAAVREHAGDFVPLG